MILLPMLLELVFVQTKDTADKKDVYLHFYKTSQQLATFALLSPKAEWNPVAVNFFFLRDKVVPSRPVSVRGHVAENLFLASKMREQGKSVKELSMYN